jgi:endonuclease YncB( thermonuclease family)
MLSMLARATTALAAVMVVLALPAWAGERCMAIDGGTLRCGSERVRIEDLRAPKLDEPGGEEARQRLQRLIRSGELTIERGNQDRYGRTRARVYVNGNRITQTDINAKSRLTRRTP